MNRSVALTMALWGALAIAIAGAGVAHAQTGDRGGGLVKTGAPAPAGPATDGPGASPQGGQVWGLFVGVSRFANSDLNLTFADRDARVLHRLFSEMYASAVPADHFVLLENEQASRGQILKSMRSMLARAEPEDLVVLFFATHGLPDAGGTELFFFTHETDPNLPEDKGLAREEVMRAIRQTRAKKMVLLLDACHAGGFGSNATLLATRGVRAAETNALLKAIALAQEGVAVLSSASAAERAQEGPQFCGGHGAFTCALVTGLKGAADSNHNGYVELRELSDYAYAQVRDRTDGLQHPMIDGRYDNALPLSVVERASKVADEPVLPTLPQTAAPPTRVVPPAATPAPAPAASPPPPPDKGALAAECADALAQEKYAVARPKCERACDAGDAQSCHGLGAMSLFGKGMPRDTRRARDLLKRACDGGQREACRLQSEIP
jgi:hypothetical protein